MKLKEAIELIINEAEVSALGNKDDTQLNVLKAIEVFKYFYDKSPEQRRTINLLVLRNPKSEDYWVKKSK